MKGNIVVVQSRKAIHSNKRRKRQQLERELKVRQMQVRWHREIYEWQRKRDIEFRKEQEQARLERKNNAWHRKLWRKINGKVRI